MTPLATNGPKGPKTKGQSSAHGDQTSNHLEIDICSGLFSVALTCGAAPVCSLRFSSPFSDDWQANLSGAFPHSPR
jgi:hypothetical protein